MTDEIDVLGQLEAIQAAGMLALEAVQNEKDLQAWRVAHLGRSAPVMQVFSIMGRLPKEERAQVGQRANAAKGALEAAAQQREAVLREASLRQSLQSERLDVTMPGRAFARGRLHIVTQTLREVTRILGNLGFQVYRSPEVESDELNFQLLNIPPHHPARDMQDTFHTTTPGVLLRTHTSPGQIHAMREYAPDPVRVILPGMVYRYEQVSARSETQFNQIELLAVGKNITLGDLKGTLTEFARQLYGSSARTRLRPSYFPFTEPSGEMDVECFMCGGKGCQICKQAGWLEIGGCGMVHPVVLQNGGYDPKVYSGFAAGMGLERIALLRHRIEDIRNFWADDARFLEQF